MLHREPRSTEMAERVYAAAGFRDLGRFLEYTAEPGARYSASGEPHLRRRVDTSSRRDGGAPPPRAPTRAATRNRIYRYVLQRRRRARSVVGGSWRCASPPRTWGGRDSQTRTCGGADPRLVTASERSGRASPPWR